MDRSRRSPCRSAYWARLLTPMVLAVSGLPSTMAAEPTKESLLQTLKKFQHLLETKQYEDAARLIVAPTDFKPERLSSILERQEISTAGIQVLERDARFGKASQVFKPERAKYFAERAEQDVDKCYGFNHERNGEFGEVVGVWEGASFRLVRVDDVGKLAAMPTESKVDAARKMLPELEAAVEKNPQDVPARARYAQALFQVGNLPVAWRQLLEARKLDSQHGGVAKGIGEVAARFEAKGLFSVGVPAETIKSLLGAPEKVVDMSWGKRWVYAFYGVELVDGRVHEFIDLRGATNDWFQPTETVQVDLDGRTWVCSFRRKAKGVVTALYFPAGQTMTNWEEQFEVQRIVGGAKAGSAEQIAQLLVKQMTTRYPQAQTKILDADQQSSYIAIKLPSPMGDSRNQLVRLLLADKDVHRISYTAKTDNPSAATQQKWLKLFQAAKLKPVE